MKRIFLAAAALVMGLASCTKEAADTERLNGDMTARFTLSLSGSGEVVYPKSRAAVQDEPEYKINKLTLYQFAVNGGTATYFEKHAINTLTDLQSLSAGEYSFSMTIPAKYYNQQRRFVFVANDDQIAEPTEGTTYEEFCQTLASVALTDGQDASELAKADKGIAMSGSGKVDGQEVFTLTSSFACAVELVRIVARVDVVNRTPNLVITGISMKQAAQKAWLMPQSGQTAPGAPDYVETLAVNADVQSKLSTSYEAQNNNGLGIQKALYMYERENAEGNTATVEISYTINNGTQGAVSVPFRKTGDDKSWVNIRRNHLYKVVLGNGSPATTDKVEVQLFDEDWNVVEIPSDVDCEQDKMNAALKVNRFTPFNVRTLSGKTVTFCDRLDNTVPDDPKSYYFTWNELNEKGLTKSDGSEILTDAAGNRYRLPTEGELNLLLPMWTESNEQTTEADGHKGQFHPCWNDNTSTNTTVVIASQASTTGWDETIYLTNNAGCYPDKESHPGETDGEHVISGRSWMKRGETASTVNYSAGSSSYYNEAPVYGLRFRGTSQYAAYRWENCKLAEDDLERYFSIKIKALKKDDGITTIDDVAQESFWADGYIEFKFPASGWYSQGANADNPTADNISHRGVNGYCWSSSLWGEGSNARNLFFGLNNADVYHLALGFRFPLRLVRAQE